MRCMRDLGKVISTLSFRVPEVCSGILTMCEQSSLQINNWAKSIPASFLPCQWVAGWAEGPRVGQRERSNRLAASEASRAVKDGRSAAERGPSSSYYLCSYDYKWNQHPLVVQCLVVMSTLSYVLSCSLSETLRANLETRMGITKYFRSNFALKVLCHCMENLEWLLHVGKWESF